MSEFERPRAVAAVGASAGGVEALRAMFREAKPGAGIAYLVLLHLDPNHNSSLPEILARDCALPVIAAEKDAALLADMVLVVPPGVEASVAGGRVVLRPADVHSGAPRSIDVLFTALAKDVEERAIGVVLSGFGSDGTLGLKAIREGGGLTVAQASAMEGGAGYPAMPSSAIATGIVDFVLPATAICGKLAEYVEGFGALAVLATAPDDVPAEDQASAEAARSAICDILRREAGHDFGGYKPRTFFRRVQRRMQVLRLDRLEGYVARLDADHDEALALFRDLLISVTAWFRDPDGFDTLAGQVIPRLFDGKGKDDAVRVWVPGCATGEEAYSLAMLLREYAATLPVAPRLQIFATDIDEAALRVARAGRYPEAQLEGLSPERRRRFFAQEGAVRVVTKELREVCLFSTHSLIREPPFSRLDLISCRNLLIYLDSALQRDIFPLFHFALRRSGYLFIGAAESAGQFADLFMPLDKHSRIYQRRDHVSPTSRLRLPRAPLGFAPRLGSGSRPTTGAGAVRQTAETLMLDRFTAPFVVVNREGDVVHFSSRTGEYLEPAPGQPTRSLFALARRGLRLDLRSALQEALRTRLRVTRVGVDIGLVELGGRATLTIEPFPDSDPADPLFLVVFAELAPPATATGPALGTPSTTEAALDARELAETRERLQTLIEEYETALEELKASNEELVSVNEEMQSANEELETAKEEQQSVNEELQMVNHELHSKVEDLDRANADLSNLFEATRVSTVMLDRNLAIRGFTPAVAALFSLRPGDRGRPLAEIVSTIDSGPLLADARAVLAGAAPVERQITRRDGHGHYLLRVLPYLTAERTVDGVIIAFIEVTQLVEAIDAREHQRVLVGELNHRVRNMLQVVIGLSKQTLREELSAKDFSHRLIGRMQALSRAYQLISAEHWGDVKLFDLVADQLEPHLPSPDRGSVEGPGILLTPAAGVSLGLVLHELATNAVKYGALSAEHGRVAVRWTVEGKAPTQSLALVWEERGGPAAPKPDRKGFGTGLMQRQVAYALHGKFTAEFGVAGIIARISLPLGGTPLVASVL
jgi:two-component system CheB/CheR fusion protein